MSLAETWKMLSADSGPELVLALDFDVTGRPQAGFGELTANLRIGHSVWLSLPPDADTGKDLDETAYLDRWLAAPRSSGKPVRAVLGYCVGAVYAAAIAERVADWQRTPPLLVLLDPEPAVGFTLYSQFRNVLSLLTALVPPEQLDAVQEAGRRAYEATGDLDTLAKTLITIFEDLSGEALARAGLDEISRRELTGTFFAFMTYLTTAARFDPFPGWRSATALSSSSPASGLNAVRSYRTGTADPLVAQEIPFATDHIGLLRAPEVAATVTDLLNA
ncbi:hypothetical protein [Crossiella sp. CA198]|uniref:hypothetical protein n=1 Tax=Crossiella sp. CA198 TaxID=3455607 RepID=UPI003F8D5AFD